jgi:NAD(P)H-dependent FMN reductase
MKIVALSGSLRRASFNTALLRAARSVAPAGVEIEIATLHGVPLYDGDVEATSGVPEVVQRLKDVLRQANGVLIASPEYNGSIPGVLKNGIDWMSRPPSDIAKVFGKRPVGLIGATPGRGGTRLAQAAWLPVLRQLGMVPFFESSLFLDGAREKFDEAGQLVDAKILELLERYVAGFAAFIAKLERAAAASPS